jgi:hypothetical protein
MTFTRALLVTLIFILAVDHQFGSGRLFQSAAAKTADIGNSLSYRFSTIVQRIAP